jgi:hypothetical protein
VFQGFLFRVILAMKESSTYMALYEEGRILEAKRILFRVGEKQLGPADESTRARINAIEDIDRLEALIDGVDKAASWSELLQNG